MENRTMTIGTINGKSYWITKFKGENKYRGNLFSNYETVEPSDGQKYYRYVRINGIMKKRYWDDTTKRMTVQSYLEVWGVIESGPIKIESNDPDIESESETKPETKPACNKVELQKTIQGLIDFFNEFDFEPNYRFVNTFAYAITTDSHRSYVANYFKLTDNGYANSIIEKMKSLEFDVIVSNFKKANPTKKINSRFKVYFGSAGTGKTTKAMEEADGNVIVCHSAMLPSDLMEDFKFDDGKAGFHPSALWRAMVEGKKIVLDEINLLPFESLRFLQGLLDGKSEITYKGVTVKIADDFQVIGTMNLTLGGTTYSLPEPLVDRASELVEYKLTADKLVSALC